jgi:fibronectin-binding autotransporter adhesin
MNFMSQRLTSFISGVVMILLALAAPSTAQTWTGAVSGNWSNASNWSPAGVPVSGQNTHLTFGAATSTAMTDDITGIIINQMTFNSGDPSYSLSGNALAFQANSSAMLPSIVVNSANPVIISNAITLFNGLTVSANGTASNMVTLAGAISGASGLTFTGGGNVRLSNTANTADITANGVFLYSNDLSTDLGSGAFGTLGTGKITLGGSLLIYDGPTANCAKPLTTSSEGFQIQVVNPSTNLTMAGVISGSVTPAPGAAIVVHGSNVVGSPSTVTLTALNTYTLPTEVTYQGILAVPMIGNAGSGGVASPLGASSNAVGNLILGDAVNGRGDLLLAGTNATYSTDRGVTVQGMYAANGGGAIGVTPGVTLTWNGQITGAGSFIKTGLGTLVLAATNNNYTGGTYIEGGTLTLLNTMNIYPPGLSVIPPGTNVTVDAGAVFNTGPLAGGSAITLGTLTLNGGAVTSFGSPFVTLFLSGTTGIISNASAGTSTVAFDSRGVGSIQNVNANQFQPTAIQVAAGTTFSGVDLDIFAALDRNGTNPTFVKTGFGVLRLNSTYTTADLVVSQGTLRVDNFAALGTGAFTLDGGTFFYGGATATIPKAIALAVGGAGGAAGAGGTIEVGASTATVLTATGAITGPWPLTVAGPGILVLTNTGNSFIGLTISAGTVETATDATLGAGTITINGNGSLIYTATAATSRSITFGSNGGTIGVMGVATILTATGAITGPGPLTVAGPGVLVLTNTGNSFSSLTINAGNVEASNDAALGAGPITINGYSSLQYSGTTSTSRSITLNSATLQVAGGTTLTLNGAIVNGGFLVGPGTTVVTGGAVLSGMTTFTSTPISQIGPGAFTYFTNGGPLTLAPGMANPAVFAGFTNQGSGAITIGAASGVNARDFQSYGLLTLNPAVVGSGQFTLLTNVGTTPLYFNGGSRTFIGTPATAGPPTAPNFVAGIDLHGQNAVVAGGLFVNNGFVVDSSSGGTGTATIVADFGALVKGAGYFQNPIITQNGGKVQAGNSPGSASFGRFVFGPGGVSNYVFAIDDATGQAGPSPDALGHVSGWGLINAVQHSAGSVTSTGDFTWTASPANKLSVALDTLVNPTTIGTDVAGAMADFDPNSAYSWPAAKWAGTYSGPTDVAALDASTSFDASGFLNPIAGTFGWSLDPASQTLSLVYTPSAVPEPGTFYLAGAAAIGWVAYRRRARTLPSQFACSRSSG